MGILKNLGLGIENEISEIVRGLFDSIGDGHHYDWMRDYHSDPDEFKDKIFDEYFYYDDKEFTLNLKKSGLTLCVNHNPNIKYFDFELFKWGDFNGADLQFRYCKELKYLNDIPYNLHSIEFSSCHNLRSLKILQGNRMPNEIFIASCGALKTIDDIDYNYNLRSLYVANCNSLKSIVVNPHYGVSLFSNDRFALRIRECKKLTSLNIKDTCPYLNVAIEDNKSLTTLKVSDNILNNFIVEKCPRLEEIEFPKNKTWHTLMDKVSLFENHHLKRFKNFPQEINKLHMARCPRFDYIQLIKDIQKPLEINNVNKVFIPHRNINSMVVRLDINSPSTLYWNFEDKSVSSCVVMGDYNVETSKSQYLYKKDIEDLIENGELDKKSILEAKYLKYKHQKILGLDPSKYIDLVIEGSKSKLDTFEPSAPQLIQKLIMEGLNLEFKLPFRMKNFV